MCALMGQGIQCTRCDGTDTMHCFQTNAHALIGICQCREGNTHTTGGGAANACADCDGYCNEYQRGDGEVLQMGNQIMEPVCLLYHAAEADNDRSVQDGRAGVCRTLVEYLNPAVDICNLLEHQHNR